MLPSSSVRASLARLLRLAPLALLLAGAACSDAVAPSPMSAPGSLNLGALHVRVATEVIGASSPNGPTVLRTVVTLTNRGAWPLELRMPACPLHVAGHRLASRTDAPGFVFPGPPPLTSTGPCIASIVGVTVAPGATHEIVAAVDLAELRAAVPPGRWFLRAELRLDAAERTPAALPAGDVTL